MTQTLDLRDKAARIEAFLIEALMSPKATDPDAEFAQIGLYSCPWSGWISLNLSHAPQPALNCPDMDEVEVALLELPDWALAHETHEQLKIVGLDGQVDHVDMAETGDEGFNEPIFRFLLEVAGQARVRQAAKSLNGSWIGVQMLDSEFAENFRI
jgi:hypothetical protein